MTTDKLCETCYYRCRHTPAHCEHPEALYKLAEMESSHFGSCGSCGMRMWKPQHPYHEDRRHPPISD